MTALGAKRLITGGAAAILAAAILLLGIVALAIGEPQLTNWLAMLVGISAGSAGLTLSSLRAVNPVDIALLVAAAVTFIGLWRGPGRRRKVWMAIAVALPLAGIAVLLATGLWGRSGLMGGGLVLSFLMVGDRTARPLGYLGLAANSLLLAADLATTGTRAPLVAGLAVIGYLLLIVWFLSIAVSLLRPRSGEAPLS